MMKSISMRKSKEQGIVSIIVATMMILIVSLLVLAFAQVARRESRESLDNHLSMQAFYAAESGINDAKSLIAADAAAGTIQPRTTSCTSPNYPSLNNGGSLSSDNSIGYTCVLIDPNPTSLTGSISNIPKVFTLQQKAGNVTSIKITWSPPSESQNGTIPTGPLADCPVAGALLPTNDYNCAYGGLRFDLVPGSPFATDRNSLLDNEMVAFLVPASSGGAVSTAYLRGSNKVRGVACAKNASGIITTCSQSITGLNATTYYLRLSQLYAPSNVVIQLNGGAPTVGSQVQIDSTGRAQDVLRRIVVSVPLTPPSAAVPAGLMSGDSVCKHFAVNTDTYINKISAGGDKASDPLCNIN